MLWTWRESEYRQSGSKITKKGYHDNWFRFLHIFYKDDEEHIIIIILSIYWLFFFIIVIEYHIIIIFVLIFSKFNRHKDIFSWMILRIESIRISKYQDHLEISVFININYISEKIPYEDIISVSLYVYH